MTPKAKSDKFDKDKSFLRSVERTLDALEMLSLQQPMGVTDLAKKQGISTSTAHRILATLQEKGFASRDAETGKYVLGHKVFEMTRAAVNSMEPLKYVRPFLDEVCKECRENVVYAVVTRTKTHTVVVAEKISDNSIQAKSCLFERFPIHACACGKAYLLTLGDEYLDEYLSTHSLQRFTRRTRASPNGLKRQLRYFKELGYTISRDELINGISAVCSAIYGHANKFAGGLVALGPSSRFTDNKVKRLGRSLRDSAAKLSLQFKVNGIE